MGRTKKKPVFVLIGDTLWHIGEDYVLDFESESEYPLAEKIDHHVADAILLALRKSFTLTFPENPFIDGLTEALNEIRRLCVEALIDMPEALDELKLPPVPALMDDERIGRPQIFKYSFAKASDLRFKVKYEGKTRSLYNLLQADSGDDLIRTARNVIALTFSEMFNEEQYEDALHKIRDSIWYTLPAFNEYLMDIEAEPISEKCESVSADG